MPTKRAVEITARARLSSVYPVCIYKISTRKREGAAAAFEGAFVCLKTLGRIVWRSFDNRLIIGNKNVVKRARAD